VVLIFSITFLSYQPQTFKRYFIFKMAIHKIHPNDNLAQGLRQIISETLVICGEDVTLRPVIINAIRHNITCKDKYVSYFCMLLPILKRQNSLFYLSLSFPSSSTFLFSHLSLSLSPPFPTRSL